MKKKFKLRVFPILIILLQSFVNLLPCYPAPVCHRGKSDTGPGETAAAVRERHGENEAARRIGAPGGFTAEKSRVDFFVRQIHEAG